MQRSGAKPAGAAATLGLGGSAALPALAWIGPRPKYRCPAAQGYCVLDGSQYAVARLQLPPSQMKQSPLRGGTSGQRTAPCHARCGKGLARVPSHAAPVACRRQRAPRPRAPLARSPARPIPYPGQTLPKRSSPVKHAGRGTRGLVADLRQEGHHLGAPRGRVAHRAKGGESLHTAQGGSGAAASGMVNDACAAVEVSSRSAACCPAPAVGGRQHQTTACVGPAQ